MGVEVVNGEIYLSYKILYSKYNISKKTIESWATRNIGKRLYISKETHICYNSIPISTRKKLPTPTEIIASKNESQDKSLTDSFFRRLESAFLKGYTQYRQIYQDQDIKPDEIKDYARHHAVWAELLKIHGERKRPPLHNIWEAYSRLYPGKYKYHCMNRNIKTCQIQGIERLLIKKYKGSNRKYDEVYDNWIITLLRSGKKYSDPYIHNAVCQLAKEQDMQLPSLSTVKRRIKKLEPDIIADRYGSDHNTYSVLPYASMIRATKSNVEWQIDGWRLPFLMEDYKSLTLFGIVDAHSGMIIGYEVSYTENTECILRGLENAVVNTGVLPLEIVSDNHSFNKTEEAKHFKDNLEKYAGTAWTVSSNPRYKSIVERSFKTFGEQYCKEMPGYIGEGIKSKNKKAHTTQELKDKYTKSGGWLTEEQIKLIAIKCVESYNNTKGKDGKTRKERYEANMAEECLKVDIVDRLRIFTRAREYTIRRAQINIIREGVTHEFQLRASLFNWNDKKVLVRYANFDEIYLYEIGSEKYIGCVEKKELIHGALADQTEEDKQKLFRHKGRLNGIKTQQKQRVAALQQKAYELHPAAVLAMNAKLKPKDFIEEFETDLALQAEAHRLGVDLSTVTNFPKVWEVTPFDPESSNENVNKRRESPMIATPEEISKFNINDYITEDE